MMLTFFSVFVAVVNSCVSLLNIKLVPVSFCGLVTFTPK